MINMFRNTRKHDESANKITNFYSGSFAEIPKSLKDEIKALEDQFVVPKEKLKAITDHFVKELEKGNHHSPFFPRHLENI